ncbi:hypothetical protein DL93DRAFT_1599770 [Clavulina sp. PMI_390]|nr:hypothetical protein DL93DRAFT_1599770 [Clavulina sp. PMI_390]
MTIIRTSALPHLPPELWLLVFEQATTITTFYDSYWIDASLWSPFQRDASSLPFDAHAQYEQHRETLRSMILVCRHWRDLILGSGLFYRHLFIRNLTRLQAVVLALEQSKFSSASKSTPNIGRYITHVRLLGMPHAPVGQRDDTPDALNFFERRLTDYEARKAAGTASSTYISYLQRFLACCPNLQVILDSSSQGKDEECFPFLESFVLGSSPRSGGGGGLLSLEYTQGTPSLRDLATNPSIISSLRHLRASTLQFPQDPKTLHSLRANPLRFPNLLSLDLHISSSHFGHWEEATHSLNLPALSHLVVRAPHAAAAAPPFLGSPARHALECFFGMFGATLTRLELVISAAPVAAAVARPRLSARDTGDPWNSEDILNVSALLKLCSTSLVELVLDTALVLPPSSGSNSTLDANHPSSTSLRRIGLRGVEISALLTNLAFQRSSKSDSATRTQKPHKAMPPIPLSTRKLSLCPYCRIHGRESPEMAAAKISQSISAILDAFCSPSQITHGRATGIAQPKSAARADGRLLTEVHLLPPPPNSPRSPGEIDARPCCLRGAPSTSLITEWTSTCSEKGVQLRVM